jgi:membrane carboxypeptidase/penicillin-binding protein
MKENFQAGQVTQGASTITQQLARQTFKLLEKSYKRKILEAFIAQRIEKHFSKPEILELYLNRIFFGANFYGVQAAARGYFGKDVKELTIEESATIVRPDQEPQQHPAHQASAAGTEGAQLRARPHGQRGHADKTTRRPSSRTSPSSPRPRAPIRA